MRYVLEFVLCLFLALAGVIVGIPHIMPQHACLCATMADGSKVEIGR